MQAPCYGFNSSKFLMLKLCSPNNNTLQKSGVLDVNDIVGIGSCGMKGVTRHLGFNHVVVDPVLILILVILSYIPSLKLKAKVVKRFDKSGIRSLLFSLGCSLFLDTPQFSSWSLFSSVLNLVNCWKHCWQTNKLCHN